MFSKFLYKRLPRDLSFIGAELELKSSLLQPACEECMWGEEFRYVVGVNVCGVEVFMCAWGGVVYVCGGRSLCVCGEEVFVCGGRSL